MSNKAWLVRPNPADINRINEFQTENIVAIGWPGIGDLTGKTRQDLKEILSNPPYSYTALALGNAYATVDIFVNQMNKGDLVLTPDGDNIYLGVIASNYQFNPKVDNISNGYSHQRTVEWHNKITREDLSKALRSSLKVHRTAADLSHHYNEIKARCFNMPIPKTATTGPIKISYPLRPNFNISFEIPADMTKEEAERLKTFISTLHFKD
ncbi:restriction endonuclease [Phascolarctobacterium succinatutens]|uniref:restriction endonuclease n=1 Tax=Phascolarctobacterium succinatutens TaxID=626940 RepID=UPI003FD8D154